MSVGLEATDESDEAMTLVKLWWWLTRPFFIHPLAIPFVTQDDDPHATAIIELMREFPEDWGFQDQKVSYKSGPGEYPYRIWTKSGEKGVAFFPDEEPEFTPKGKERVWKALKGLKALQVYAEMDRAHEVREEVNLEERVREKTSKLPEN